jgi:pyridoxine/pyridoxamine 5'-phosphate oxidase
MDLQEERIRAGKRMATARESGIPDERIPLLVLFKGDDMVGLVVFVFLNIIITNHIFIRVPC